MSDPLDEPLDEPPPSDPPPPLRAQMRFQGSEVWRGIGLGALLDVLGLGLAFLLGGVGIVVFGVFQLLWIVPAMIVNRKRRGVVLGLAIAASLAFLLNVACFGIVLLSFR